MLIFAALVLTGIQAPVPVLAREPLTLPNEVAAPVGVRMAAEAAVVTIGDRRLELWWVRTLEIGAPAPGDPWSAVPEGALVGVLRIEQPTPDIRGYLMKPGVYTLRFGRQPQDGDHMGISPYREFLLVCPAAEDVSADPLGHKGAVALAKKTSGRAHPAALSVDPPRTADPPGAVARNTEFDLTGVVFEVPTSSPAGPAGPVRFGLVVRGRIDQ